MSKNTSDAVQETIKQTDSAFERFDKIRKKVFEHFAAIVSIGTIALFIILYAYEKAFYAVYNIPVSSINLDIKTFLEVATQVCFVYLLIVYYYSSYKTEKIKGHIRVNPLRWFWATLVFFNIYHFNSLPDKWYVVVPVCLLCPGVIELVLFVINRQKKEEDKVLSKKEYDYKVDDLTANRIAYLFATKSGIIFIVLFTLLAYLWGNIKGINKRDFQVLQSENSKYVIIVDYKDKALVQKCEEQEDSIVIYINQYWFINKEDKMITYKKYKIAEIVK